MTTEEFRSLLAERILVLDGAMGTMVQRRSLGAADWQGTRFAGLTTSLKGNNDILVLTRPDVIADIHRLYIEAGADIISTDSFNANRISQADYRTEELVGEINRSAAAIARREADRELRASGRRIIVAGSMGPTNRSASISQNVDDPAERSVSFDTLSDAYAEQARGLIEGGADVLLIETVFDTLNLKAALDGARRAMSATGRPTAVMVSATIADRGGHTLSGQTLEALLASVGADKSVVSVGLNCSFGARDLMPHLRELARVSPFAVSCHPNAGLPDEFGAYTETPEAFVEAVLPAVADGCLNIVGGCCGTTPDHIRLLAEAVGARGVVRPLPAPAPRLWLSGLEAFDASASDFTIVGERCNVAGSRKFLRLIKEGNFNEALAVAAAQIDAGAMVIDINMDDPMLDAREAMKRFLLLAGSEPSVAKVPVMIDSSDWIVVEEALKCVQGKSIVNSISLKEGEAEFLRKARRIAGLGAAVVVMAFDEQGQADTFERRRDICARAYRLLTAEAGFNPADIIFDPNVMAVATGIEAHDSYALDFIRATEWIKQNLPHAKVSGGVSNLSFAFRGHNALREAMHAVFLYHARRAGLDMAIVNPSAMMAYESVEPELRSLLDDVILARGHEAVERLSAYAVAEPKADSAKNATDLPSKEAWREADVLGRLRHAVVNGVTQFLEADIDEAVAGGMTPAELVGGPLMDAMREVGDLFGAGKMFLPQVVKTARTMKLAVEILRPLMKAGADVAGPDMKRARVVFATVKGDVHDIGKNIVSIVMECNNIEVVDLGVMVPAEAIVEAVKKYSPDAVCLSGLISPSLAEMVTVAETFEREGIRVPVIVGGAATSAAHTASRIAPVYSAPVVHARDASQNPLIVADIVAGKLEAGKPEAAPSAPGNLLSLDEARNRRSKAAGDIENIACRPASGTERTLTVELTAAEVVPAINWNYFFVAWKLEGRYLAGFPFDASDEEAAAWIATLGPEAAKASEAWRLYADARRVVSQWADSMVVARGLVRFAEVRPEGDDIVIAAGEHAGKRLPMLRSQTPDSRGECLSLVDFVAPADDHIGLFAVTALEPAVAGGSADSYHALLIQTLRDRVAEAASEVLHMKVRRELWGYAADEDIPAGELRRGIYCGIRPAIGYPSLPDQTLTHSLGAILPLGEIGVTLTENGAMNPPATVAGLYIASPSARYFRIGAIDSVQAEDYARRRGLSAERVSALIPLVSPEAEA